MPTRTSGRSCSCERASRSPSSSTARRTRAGTWRAAARGSSSATPARRRSTRRSSPPARASASGPAPCTASRRSRTRRSSRSRPGISTTSSGSRIAMDARAPAVHERRLDGAHQGADAPALPALGAEIERILRWDGCVNVRDLGGLPLAGGGETAYRVVVRADSLPGLTEAGRRSLVDYGVTLVVNLRPQREDEEDDPTDGLPVPVVREAMDPRRLNAAWEWPSMREAYLELADHYRGELARALSALGAAEPP